MKKCKVLMWSLLAITIVLYAAMSLLKHSPEETVSPAPVNPVVAEKPDVHRYVIEKLLEHDWTQEAAEAVWKNQEEFFLQMAELNIQDLDTELVMLYRLGKPEIQAALKWNPEYAPLFCSVMNVDPEGPQNIIRTLPKDEEGQTIIADLYQIYADSEDAASLAKLLQNSEWRDRIIQLVQKSQVNIEMILYFQMIQELQLENPNSLAASTFEAWLFKILDEYLTLDPASERAAELQTILAVHSENIKNEMKKDDGFCTAFPECWRQFESLLNSLDREKEDYELYWASYCQDVEVFRFLYEYKDLHAEELYKKYSVAGTEILMSPTFLDPKARVAREKLVQLLLVFNSQEDVQAILTSQPHKNLGIVNLLSRGLPDDYYRVIFRNLAIANMGEGEYAGNASGLISTWTPLSNDALKKELGLHVPGLERVLPGYDVYCLCEKLAQGREVTGMDVAMAGIDGACAVFDVITVGTSKPITTTLSTASKGMKVVAKGGLKSGVKKVLKEGTKAVAKEEIKKSSFQIVRTLKMSKRLLSGNLSQSTKGIDITKYVRTTFEKAPLKCKTFKKWTGLEPRIFMRRDRKVLLHLERLPQTKVGKLAGNIMHDMAIDCGMEYVLGTDTAQSTIQKGKEIVENPKEITLKWKKNLSMWWRLNQ